MKQRTSSKRDLVAARRLPCQRAAGVGLSLALALALALALTLAPAFSAGCGDDPGAAGGGGNDTESRAYRLGTTYQVGPGLPYANLQAVANNLAPGDVVEVYGGGAAYPGGVIFRNDGSASSKITIRGIRVNGQRPAIAGSLVTVEFRASHYVFEGFDASGGTSRVLYHHGDDITIRDTVVHDCPAHGILGADNDSGSLTLDYVEVYRCGSGDTHHPIYVTSDQIAHPGSVFRMQHCYVHDGLGGNNVKSRAERSEIYYNWIEGGFYRELELIAPEDPAYNLYREDGDVVGNVFVKRGNGTNIARIGGDGGGGGSRGRYRFTNNTFVLSASSPAVIQAFDKVQTLEMHNNVFYRVGGGGVQVLRDSDATWVSGKQVVGQDNWAPAGSDVPATFTGTLAGSAPGFGNVGSNDLHLVAGTPLANAGTAGPQGPAGLAFPSPLMPPKELPPPHALQAAGAVLPRPTDTLIDIGAYELGTTTPPPPSCLVSSGSMKSQGFASRSGSFTAETDVTPSQSSMDGAVALSLGAQGSWRGLAAIVLFNPSGGIVARNGGTYQAAGSIPYTGGGKYHVRVAANVSRHTYSIYITPPGGSEVTLGADYAFRTEQAGNAALDTFGVLSDTGTLTACNLVIR